MLLSWLRGLRAKRRKRRPPKADNSRWRNRAILGCERLEDRTVPASFTVNNLNNAGNGSLRWAIEQVNASMDTTNEIEFQAGLSGTISLTQVLPAIKKDVSIYGPEFGDLTAQRGTGNSQFQDLRDRTEWQRLHRGDGDR